MREKMAVFCTILGAGVSLASALAMQDHVRLVEILGLFFGAFGSGASVAMLVATRRSRRPAIRHDS
jgi:hypothetical protein